MSLTDFQDQPPSRDQSKDINFVKEAFHLQYNWIALAGAGAFALLSAWTGPVAARLPGAAVGARAARG